jgi:hypothetical protein
LLVYNTNFYCRLALGDEVVDRGTYARPRLSTSNSSSSQSCQSRDDQTDEMLRHHDEWIQYIILMIQVNIFKYVIFSILYKYCLTMYLTTSCSKGRLCTVRRRCHRFSRPTTPGDPSTPQVDSSQVGKTIIYFIFKAESRLLNMHDSIYFLLQASHIS